MEEGVFLASAVAEELEGFVEVRLHNDHYDTGKKKKNREIQLEMVNSYAAPIYAVIEGIFLGIFTTLIDDALIANQVAVTGGVALQAFIITLAILIAMLILYTTRIIQPTRKFRAVVGTCMLGIFLVYLISLPLYLFGIDVPFISAFTTPTSGTGMLIGFGINIFILVIAALMLIIDFGIIEDRIKAGSPKRMEWFCGFILLVTLAWIYIQCVELVARIALASRD